MSAPTWQTPIVEVDGAIVEATFDWLSATYGPAPSPLDEVVRAAVTAALTSNEARPAEYLSPAQFAKRLGVDRKTIDRQLAHMTEGVHFLRLGRRVAINVAAAKASFAGRESRALNTDQSLLDAFIAKARR